MTDAEWLEGTAMWWGTLRVLDHDFRFKCIQDMPDMFKCFPPQEAYNALGRCELILGDFLKYFLKWKSQQCG